MKKASCSALASPVCHVFVTYSHEVVTHLCGFVISKLLFLLSHLVCWILKSCVLDIENIYIYIYTYIYIHIHIYMCVCWILCVGYCWILKTTCVLKMSYEGVTNSACVPRKSCIFVFCSWIVQMSYG